MKNVSVPALFLGRLLALVALLAYPAAHADEYSDVSQLVRSGNLPEAMAKADQFLAAQPKDPQMRFLKGVIQRDMGKTSEAVGTFTRLTEDYPELPEPYNNLAVLYASQSQFDKARTALEMAIRTNPSYSTAHENLGDVYAKLASQAYNKALQLDNTNAAVAPKLALIRELFSATGAKGQRPAGMGASTPSVASAGAVKPPPTLPSLPSLKPVNPAGNLPSAAATSAAMTPTASASQAATTTAAAKVPAAKAPEASAPAVQAPATAPVASASPAVAANSDKEIAAVVKSWAAAWSAKDVKSYLGFYGKSFDLPKSMTRGAWEAERRDRITGKASISVKLESLAVTSTGNKATAKFRQDYRANGLAVSSRKTLELQKSGDRWYIVKESVGG
jgi:tetratricopeptide (TPR) repeat protein